MDLWETSGRSYREVPLEVDGFVLTCDSVDEGGLHVEMKRSRLIRLEDIGVACSCLGSLCVAMSKEQILFGM
jgi:hypothetical protein